MAKWLNGYIVKMKQLRLLLVFLLLMSVTKPQPTFAQTPENPWPMAGGNPQRTSWVASNPDNQTEIPGVLVPAWYRTFEPYLKLNAQVVAANNTLFIPTSKGLYALDADTGVEKWVFPTEFPIGHSPTVVGNVVYAPGMDHFLYALDINSGSKLWEFEGEKGFETNPLVINDVVFAGNRDGYLYAINAQSGQLKWKYKTDGPVLFSAAASTDNSVIYIASNDMYAYGLSASTGDLVWKSPKLLGEGFHSWWPVVYKEPVTQKEYVILPGSENYRTIGTYPWGGQFNNGLERRDIFPNGNDPQCNTKPIAEQVIYPATSDWDWAHGNVVYDMSKKYTDPNGICDNIPISEYFEEPTQEEQTSDPAGINRNVHKPWRRTYFVLDATSGQEVTFDFDNDGQKEYAPFLWFHTHSGNRYPAMVGADGLLYQSQTVSSSQYIARGRMVGWKFGTPYVSLYAPTDTAVDEPITYVGGGNMMYWTRCCDRIGASFNLFSSNSKWTYFNYNLQNPNGIIPGYNVRYYNPDGMDTIGYTSPYAAFNGIDGTYGFHGDENPLVPYNGKVYMHRSNAVVAWKVNDGKGYTTAHSDTIPVAKSPTALSTTTLKTTLENEILKMDVDNDGSLDHFQPGYIDSGIVTARTNTCSDSPQDYFHHSGDTITTLIQSMPYVGTSTQQKIKTYIQSEFNTYMLPPHPTLANRWILMTHMGWKDGGQREYGIRPPEFEYQRTIGANDLNANPQSVKYNWPYAGFNWTNPNGIYAAWKYAQETGTAQDIFNRIKTDTTAMKVLDTVPSDAILAEYPMIHNAYLAGFIGYRELWKSDGQPTDSRIENINSELDRLLALRVNQFDKHNNNIDPNKRYCVALNTSRNFTYFVPEIMDELVRMDQRDGTTLVSNLRVKVADAVSYYEDLAPYWFASKIENEYGEGVLRNLYDIQAIFLAKTMILKQSQSELTKYLDIPAFERGDLFYIQNLASILEAGNTPPPASCSLANQGDINCDETINISDLIALLTNFGAGASSSDLNNDSSVNTSDLIILLTNFGASSP